MPLLRLRISLLPAYLHRSGFYQALDRNDRDDEILIPAHCFKADDEVNSIQDFAQLLRVMIYWVIFEIPVGIVAYCDNNYYSDWENTFNRTVPNGAAIKYILPSVFTEDTEDEKNPIIRAMELGRMGIVEYLASTGHFRLDGEVAATAARLGRRDFLMVLFQNGFSADARICQQAAAGGHTDCLIYAHENGCPWDSRTLVAAAGAGYLHILQYAHQHGCPWHANICAAAAASGQLNCLEYALRNGCPHDEATVAAAVRHGHVDCLQLMQSRGIPLPTNSCTLAAEFGQTESLRYAHTNNSPWDETTANAAVRNGHVDSLSFALDNGCPHDEDTLLLAARAGSLPCLEYLVECQMLYMSPALFAAALQKAELTCVQYLVDVGCPHLDTEDDDFLNHTFTSTEDQRLRDCIRYMVEHCWQPSNRLVVHLLSQPLPECHAYLADNGFAPPLPPSASAYTPVIPAVPTSECMHTTQEEDVLATEAPWLESQDAAQEEVETEPLSAPDVTFVAPDSVPDPVPFRSPSVPPRGLFLSREDSDGACRAGNIDVLHFLHEEGVEWTVSSMAAAAEGGHLGCVRFLHKVGCPWDKTTTKAAARGGHVGVLSYVLQRDCSWSQDIMMHAAWSGSQPCLQLLIQLLGNFMLQDPRVFEAALTRAHLDCVQYLLEVGCKIGRVKFLAPLTGFALSRSVVDSQLSQCILLAAQGGWKWDTQFLNFLREHKYSRSRSCAIGVDRTSRLPCLRRYKCPLGKHRVCSQHVHSNRYFTVPLSLQDSYRVWNRVCALGCLECARSLYDQWMPWNGEACATAARRGNLTCVKYLFEHGCPWDARTMHSAAQGGHLDILQFAWRRECPNTDDSVSLKLALTAPVNNLACAKFLVDECSIVLDQDGSVFGVALLCADLPCVKYLFDIDCPYLNFRFAFDRSRPREVIPLDRDAELAQCLQIAVRDRGWPFDANLVDYVWHFNLTECIDFCVDEWNVPAPLVPVRVAVDVNYGQLTPPQRQCVSMRRILCMCAPREKGNCFIFECLCKLS